MVQFTGTVNGTGRIYNPRVFETLVSLFRQRDSMEALIQTALAFVKDKWHSRTGLVVALSAAAVFLIVIFAGIDLEQVSRSEWIITSLVLVSIYIFWSKTTLPRVPKGRVGFGIAIQFEDSEHERKLRSDFLLTLRELLASSRLSHQFSFIEIPKGSANKITDEEQARSIMKRVKLDFLLYGRARLRTMPQGPAHVLDLRGVVRHAPVSKKVSESLGKDFGKVLPSRLIVGPEGNMFACEFAARHIDSVARYVIGTAAALSGDFDYAEQLLLGSEERLKAFVEKEEGSPISALLHSVQKRIADLYRVWLRTLVRSYTLRREMGAFTKTEQLAVKLQTYVPNDYEAHLCAALCAFVLRRDIAKARREIEACRKIDDAAWSYSEAFLNAYEGDLEAAYRSYRKAFQSPLENVTTPIQCEEFIQMVLDQEPDRPWLYYCLGLINQRAKGDLQAARADFTNFIERSDPTRFKTAIGIARKWIDEIDDMIARGPNHVPT